MEPTVEATKLKTVIHLLRSRVDDKEWQQLALPLADAIAKLNDLFMENRRLWKENKGLKLKVQELTEDRDYWQHKWGNGNG